MGGGEIVKKGWLIKSPPLETSGMKSWRKRWFSLRSSKVLEYYKSENGDLKGVINMENCTMVHSSLFHRRYKHVFDIQTKDRTYYLVASTAEEMENWVKTLCEMCGFCPTSNDSNNVENNPPATSSNKRRSSSTLPASSISIRSSPLPPLPTETPLLHNTEYNNTHTIGSLQYSSSMSDSILKHKTTDVQIPPGTSFTQALAAKGYTMRHQSTNSSISPRSSISSITSYRQEDSYQTYDVPTNNTLAPPTGNIPTGSLLTSCEGWYDVPRSLSESSAYLSDRAHFLSNGYMVPRLLMQENHGAAALYDVPPTRATPMRSDHNIYDVPPPQRDRGISPQTDSVYDVPPPPVPCYQYQDYDHLPFRKPSGNATPSNAHILPCPPQEEPNVPLPPQEEPNVPLPPRSSPEQNDYVDSSHGYVNLKLLAEEDMKLDDDVPPPIDRTTKPGPPRIDRTTKPGRKASADSTDRLIMNNGTSKHLSTASTDTSASSSDEPFSPKDLPCITNQSIQYCQVTFLRKPVPTPRTKLMGVASAPIPPNRTVNYVDVDLSAIQQQRKVNIVEKEHEEEEVKYKRSLERFSSNESDSHSSEDGMANE